MRRPLSSPDTPADRRYRRADVRYRRWGHICTFHASRLRTRPGPPPRGRPGVGQLSARGPAAPVLAAGVLATGVPAWPGHQARRPMSAVRLGEKNIAITNAASAIPADTANPSWDRIVFPARVSDANVPARISPAAAIVGAAC